MQISEIVFKFYESLVISFFVKFLCFRVVVFCILRLDSVLFEQCLVGQCLKVAEREVKP